MRVFTLLAPPLLASLLWAAPLFAQSAATPAADSFEGKPRVAIISDMGNEPDDQMSFVRFLLYSNQFDIEAMVATTSTWQKAATHPETMHALIHAYGEVRENLLLHAPGWPRTEDLDARVYSGQPAYGLASAGPGKSTAGSKALVRAILRDDPRPLWMCIWGGANTLAQALTDLRATHSEEELGRLTGKLRVYSISDQDDAGPWIRREFPRISYVVTPSRANSDGYYAATWTGISGDFYYRNGEGADSSLVTNDWLDRNIRSKGSLGKLYPRFLYIMEGDTPSFLGLIDNGLNAYRRPDWGGWGGRYVYLQPYGESHAIWSQGGDEFSRGTSQDEVKGIHGRTHVSDQATIWRWRAEFQNDFAARMDWTVQDFAHANHNPKVVVNGRAGTGVLELSSETGQTVTLDASGSSDPDRGQTLTYRWFVYPEAGLTGSGGSDVELITSSGPTVKVKVKAACRPAWFPRGTCQGTGVAHVIVAITDNGSPRLTSYRRIIFTVKAGTASSQKLSEKKSGAHSKL